MFYLRNKKYEVNKDENKAFKFYQKSEFLNAKFQLSYCYVNGIRTEVNKEKEFELYNNAAGKKDDNLKINISKNEEEIVNDIDKVNY